jgi:hypothetical protein
MCLRVYADGLAALGLVPRVADLAAVADAERLGTAVYMHLEAA